VIIVHRDIRRDTHKTVGTRAVLHENGLLPESSEPLAVQPGRNIRPAAYAHGNHETHWTLRPGFTAGPNRCCGQTDDQTGNGGGPADSVDSHRFLSQTSTCQD
jgi:hypothetical protein